MSSVIIEAHREGYNTNQVRRTMTVRELVEYLNDNFDPDSKVYFSHDDGYTFGGITYNDFDEEFDEEGGAE